MYLIWLAYLGNGGFGFGNRAGAAAGVEANDRLNNLQAQIAANQQTNTLGAGIAGNHEALHGIQGALDMGFSGTNANIANGTRDLQAAIQNCCCTNQTAILNQTNQLQTQMEGVRQATVNGFANLGFEIAQQTNTLQNTANANTQKILDVMCQNTTQSLRDTIAEKDRLLQTQSIINAVGTNSCNC